MSEIGMNVWRFSFLFSRTFFCGFKVTENNTSRADGSFFLPHVARYEQEIEYWFLSRWHFCTRAAELCLWLLFSPRFLWVTVVCFFSDMPRNIVIHCCWKLTPHIHTHFHIITATVMWMDLNFPSRFLSYLLFFPPHTLRCAVIWQGQKAPALNLNEKMVTIVTPDISRSVSTGSWMYWPYFYWA